jgi:hypothetical protein
MRYFLFFLFACFNNFSFAQNTEDSVKKVVENLFSAMRNADTVLFKNVFAGNAVLQTVEHNKEGNLEVHDEKVSDFLDFIGKEEKGNADEQIIFETVKIDGPLAFVWAPYKFYYKGRFSHCGVDSFQLVRLAGGWKIQYIIDTRRKDDCK